MKLIDKLSSLYDEFKVLTDPCRNNLGYEGNKEHWDKVVQWAKEEYENALCLDAGSKISILKSLELVIRTDAGSTVLYGVNSGLEKANSPLSEIYTKILESYKTTKVKLLDKK